MKLSGSLISLLLSGSMLLGCTSLRVGSSLPAPSPTQSELALTPLSPSQEIQEKEQSQPTATMSHAAPFKPLALQAANCEYGGAFKAIESLDELTVRFTFCSPEPAFLSKIAFPAFGIVPKGYLERTNGGGKGSLLLEKPIGTGPYRLERWAPREELWYSAFEGYWGKQKALNKNLVFKWNADDSQRLIELQTGLVQGIDQPNPQDYPTVIKEPDLVWLKRPPLSVSFIGMNNAYPPFDNQYIRQAIALGLDRQAILQENFPAGYQLASHFTPCVIPNGCVGEAWYAYDPEQARTLLADEGYPNGFQTQIAYRDVLRGYLPHPANVAKAIQAQLKTNLNIDARLIPINSEEYYHAVDDGLLPGLFLLGWGADYPDASNFMDTHFGSRASKMFGKPYLKILQPLDQAFHAFGEEVRKPLYEAANNAVHEQVPVIPIVHGAWIIPEGLAAVFSRSVQGAHVSPFGFEQFSDTTVEGSDTMIWMQGHEPLSLYCADETDVDTFRACIQAIETLYRFSKEGADAVPGLAENCEPSGDLTVWTCRLRSGVMFHDLTILDSNDVVASLLAQWDAANPYHKGRTGDFHYFKDFWGEFLNAEAGP